MSDTPETDAFFRNDEAKERAERMFKEREHLERERDEAREQIAKLLNKLDQLYRDVEIDKLKEGAK